MMPAQSSGAAISNGGPHDEDTQFFSLDPVSSPPCVGHDAVSLGTAPEWGTFMLDTYPKALILLKILCESKAKGGA